MNTIIRQDRHYFRFSLLIRIFRPPYWLLLLVFRIICHNEVTQSFWTKHVAFSSSNNLYWQEMPCFWRFFSYSDAWKIKSKSLLTSRLIFDTDRLNGDHSPNFFRQTSLLFHKWLAERFNLDDAWIVNVRYKDTSIYNALITWIGKFCTFRSQTKLFSRLFLLCKLDKLLWNKRSYPYCGIFNIYGSLLFFNSTVSYTYNHCSGTVDYSTTGILGY